MLKKFCIFFPFWLLATAALFHHTPSNFLRAESGWYLFVSRSEPAVQRDFVRRTYTMTRSGHYTPLAFLAEFATAKVIGTRAAFWKWRQIAAVAALAMMLFMVGERIGSALQVSTFQARAGAITLAAILAFQPWMREFVAWPFMIMQLLWLLLGTAALLSLIETVRRPAERRWPWYAAAAAYASLQVLGLGLATAATTAAILAAIAWMDRQRAAASCRNRLHALATLAVFTMIHGLVMVALPAFDAPNANGATSLLQLARGCLGFIPKFVVATACSVVTGARLPRDAALTGDWLYGIGILAAFVWFGVVAFRRCLRETTTRSRVQLVLRLWTICSFVSLIALIAARQLQANSPNGFADFFSGPRYLIPAGFCAVGLLAELMFALRLRKPAVQVAVYGSLTVAAIAGNLHFASHGYRQLAPQATISHARAWDAIVAMTRECRNARLPVPAVPMGTLTHDFADWDLRHFEPLLRADLQLGSDAKLPMVRWDEFATTTPETYARVAPSVAAVRKQLRL